MTQKLSQYAFPSSLDGIKTVEESIKDMLGAEWEWKSKEDVEPKS
jgi:hypothetical protein